MWTSILAFFGKGWERFLSIFAYLLILAFIIYAGWRIFNPKPTTTQTGGVSNTFHIGFGGCVRMPKP